MSIVDVVLGGLRPNTIVLGFYDNNPPEDHLRLRSFYKRRLLKRQSSKTVSSIVQESSQSANVSILSDNGTEMYSVFRFDGK